MSLDAAAARERVVDGYADVLAGVGESADAAAAAAAAVAGTDPADAAAAAPGRVVEDGPALAAALRSQLADRGVLAELPGVLVAAVDAAGGSLPADRVVAAPPYVAVTSRGPVLRATLDDGRLVVELLAFRLTGENGYERRADVAVDASVR